MKNITAATAMRIVTWDGIVKLLSKALDNHLTSNPTDDMMYISSRNIIAKIKNWRYSYEKRMAC
jgi:hypothetical protein